MQEYDQRNTEIAQAAFASMCAEASAVVRTHSPLQAWWRSILNARVPDFAALNAQQATWAQTFGEHLQSRLADEGARHPDDIEKVVRQVAAEDGAALREISEAFWTAHREALNAAWRAFPAGSLTESLLPVVRRHLSDMYAELEANRTHPGIAAWWDDASLVYDAMIEQAKVYDLTTGEALTVRTQRREEFTRDQFGRISTAREEKASTSPVATVISTRTKTFEYDGELVGADEEETITEELHFDSTVSAGAEPVANFGEYGLIQLMLDQVSAHYVAAYAAMLPAGITDAPATTTTDVDAETKKQEKKSRKIARKLNKTLPKPYDPNHDASLDPRRPWLPKWVGGDRSKWRPKWNGGLG